MTLHLGCVISIGLCIGALTIPGNARAATATLTSISPNPVKVNVSPTWTIDVTQSPTSTWVKTKLIWTGAGGNGSVTITNPSGKTGNAEGIYEDEMVFTYSYVFDCSAQCTIQPASGSPVVVTTANPYHKSVTN